MEFFSESKVLMIAGNASMAQGWFGPPQVTRYGVLCPLKSDNYNLKALKFYRTGDWPCWVQKKPYYKLRSGCTLWRKWQTAIDIEVSRLAIVCPCLFRIMILCCSLRPGLGWKPGYVWTNLVGFWKQADWLVTSRFTRLVKIWFE